MKKFLIAKGVLVFLFLVSSNPLVRADSITAGVQNCVGTTSNPCTGVVLQNALFMALPYAANGSFGPIDGAIGSYNESVPDASYGVLHIYDSTSLNMSGSASASFQDAVNAIDTMTISDGALNGQPGFLEIGYTMDATLSSSGIDQASLAVIAGIGGNVSTNFTADVYTSSVSGQFVLPQTLAFTYGVPFTFQLSLLASTGTGIFEASTNSPGFSATYAATAGSGSATVDSSNTVVLSLLLPEDQSGNPVAGATFNSTSGTVYGTDGVLPEPSTLMLIGPSLVFLLWLAAKRHSPTGRADRS